MYPLFLRSPTMLGTIAGIFYFTYYNEPIATLRLFSVYLFSVDMQTLQYYYPYYSVVLIRGLYCHCFHGRWPYSSSKIVAKIIIQTLVLAMAY